MPFLTEIKERIGSTNDTKKIAQSLQLVAASKMKGFVRKALSSRAYATGLLETLRLTVTDPSSEIGLAEKRTKGGHVFVLVTSDKGLCGSMNQRLIRHLFEGELWKNTPPKERLLVTIGRKGTDAAKRLGIQPAIQHPGIGEDITPLDALRIIDGILNLWYDKVAKKITLISPHYVSPFINHPTSKTYLPFSIDMIASHLQWHYDKEVTIDEATPPLYEPDIERVISSLTLQIIETLFLESFYELKASEYSSRMVAMKKATDSATDLISELTLEYNKARQAAITQQVSELATASEAMDAVAA
jgi:F-type H+-transporting ATPase subunit gamma